MEIHPWGYNFEVVVLEHFVRKLRQVLRIFETQIRLVAFQTRIVDKQISPVGSTFKEEKLFW